MNQQSVGDAGDKEVSTIYPQHLYQNDEHKGTSEYLDSMKSFIDSKKKERQSFLGLTRRGPSPTSESCDVSNDKKAASLETGGAYEDDEVEMTNLKKFLSRIGLQKHLDNFLDEVVSIEDVLCLTDLELKEMGLNASDRKKIQKAIASYENSSETDQSTDGPASPTIDQSDDVNSPSDKKKKKTNVFRKATVLFSPKVSVKHQKMKLTASGDLESSESPIPEPTSPSVARTGWVPIRARSKMANGEDSSLTCSDPKEHSFNELLKDFPEYKTTSSLDELRSKDYSRLDKTNQIYLDYTGSGLYGESQIQKQTDLLTSTVLGNPHSINPTSSAATDLDHSTRLKILNYFQADPEEYSVIFTSNASGAAKIIGESYPFDKHTWVLWTSDNHTSITGVREFALKKKVPTSNLKTVYVRRPHLRIPNKKVMEILQSKPKDVAGLFLYPAQSNVSGVQHPLEWTKTAQEYGWDVFLDIAAYVPSNKLSLNEDVKPDFMCISFYKMFGYPTGVGALLAKTNKLNKLKKPWFAGGTITLSSVKSSIHTKWKPINTAHWEDGTVNFLNIPGIKIGLEHIENIGIDLIHTRVTCLVGWILNQLKSLKYGDGNPVVKIYGPTTPFKRGGTVSFNMINVDGDILPYQLVENRAIKRNISIRGGCMCNSGVMEEALGFGGVRYIYCLTKGDRIEVKDFVWCSKGRPLGAARVSVGLVTNFEDVYTFIQMIEEFLDVKKVAKWHQKFKDQFKMPDSLC